jgi:arylsulfatase A-like enzyme/Flp pilus assembly protein TadD
LPALALGAALSLCCGDQGGNTSDVAAAPAARAAPPAPPDTNVLLVTLDTTRADRLGAYGHAGAHTPNLDALAAGGTLFDNAYTSCPLTLPAHATLFTGLQPVEHGLRTNGKHRLGDEIPTLAARLADRGYRTGAFVAAFVLNRKFGLDRGFATYDDSLKGAYDQEIPEQLSRYRSGSIVVDRALAWLQKTAAVESRESARAEPFFVWVHLYDAHIPYHAHDELAGTPLAGQKSYDAEVAFADLQLGRLLAFLDEKNLRQHTLVVVAADHGEGLNDHGDVEHGHLLNEEILHVPLVVALPGRVDAGRRADAIVSLRDIGPTVLELTSGADAALGGGRSLVAALTGGALSSQPSYAETEFPFESFNWSPLRSLTTERWKYVKTTRPELYDRQADRGELYNLASAVPGESERLAAELEGIIAQLKPREAAAVALDADERRRLEALGYVGAGGKAAEAKGPLPDIKDMLPAKHLETDLRIGVHKGTLEPAQIVEMAEELVRRSPDTVGFRQRLAAALLDAGRTEEAVKAFEDVLQRDPDFALAHLNLGRALARQGKRGKAAKQFREALRLDPELAEAHVSLGDLLADRGQLDIALGHLFEATRLQPDLPWGQFRLAELLMRREKPALAVERYREAVRLSPQNADFRYKMANALLQVGRRPEAIAEFREVVNLAPLHADAYNNLGAALAEEGDRDGAVAAYREAMRAQPKLARPHFNLGQLLALEGNDKAAIEELSEAVRLQPEWSQPLERLAWVLATAKDRRLRNPKRAVELGEKATELTKRSDPTTLLTVAVAYGEAKRYDDAARAAQRALKLARARKDEKLESDIGERMAAYSGVKLTLVR